MLYELVYVDIVDMGKRNFCTLLDFVQFFPEISKISQGCVFKECIQTKSAYRNSILNALFSYFSSGKYQFRNHYLISYKKTT